MTSFVKVSGKSATRSARSSKAMPSMAEINSSASIPSINPSRTSSATSTRTSPSFFRSIISHIMALSFNGNDSMSLASSDG